MLISTRHSEHGKCVTIRCRAAPNDVPFAGSIGKTVLIVSIENTNGRLGERAAELLPWRTAAASGFGPRKVLTPTRGRGFGAERVKVGRSCCSSDNSKSLLKRAAGSHEHANCLTCGNPAPPRDHSADSKYAPFDGIENTRSCRNIANIFRHPRAGPRTLPPRRPLGFQSSNALTSATMSLCVRHSRIEIGRLLS